MAVKPMDFSGVNPVGTPSSVDVFNASNQAISFREQLPDLEQKLREALITKFQGNPLFTQREQAQQGFLNAPSQARADISQMQQTSGVPLSPTQQEAITSARRSAAFAPLSSANLLLGGAFGGLEGIVGSGVKAFESAAGAQTERANLMNQMRQQEIERQFKERELALKSTGSNQPSLSQLLAIANYMKPTAGQVNEAINAESGKKAVLHLRDMIKKNPKAVYYAGVPLLNAVNPAAREYNSTAKEAYDVLVRTRTGAALNLDEQAFYEEYIPKWLDSDVLKKQKLTRLEELYNRVITEGQEFDLGSFLGASGVEVPGLGSDGFIPD
ncbi:MAG: hypothetical protein A2Y53_03905 [Chloroflexi bacterium RBG_16_47_49]|nr:MAG: hypothetical protein A2Y53_03905 [Chloroflexi bacterium RBG_16_47_49]